MYSTQHVIRTKQIAQIENLKSVAGQNEAKRYIYLELASRVLFLANWIKNKGVGRDSMRQHLLSLLNGGQDAVSRIVTCLNKGSLETLQEIFLTGVAYVMVGFYFFNFFNSTRMLNILYMLNESNGFAVFAFDKANAASKASMGTFIALMGIEQQVKDLIRKLVSNWEQFIAKLPDWVKHAKYHFKTYGTASNLRLDDSGHFQNDVEAVKFMITQTLGHCSLPSVILNPIKEMRPDCFSIGNIVEDDDEDEDENKDEYENKKDYWTFLVSAKLITERNIFGCEVLYDKNSTDYSKLYHLKTGLNINESFVEEEQQFRNAFEKYNHRGSLRIHCIYPSVAKPTSIKVDSVQTIAVEENNVIIYLTESNLQNLSPSIKKVTNFFKILYIKYVLK
ncbi:hypothetical protein HK096_008125 [Nowakowskiella sp. JEL0078]|nr:hypothetical protein HK096_008125 [Nowakowskiella sp. JEL0078]